MEISFAEKKLRLHSENIRHAERALGIEVAAILRSTLADIAALDNVSEIPYVFSHKGDRFEIVLDKGNSAIFECNHRQQTPYKRGSREIDWTKVRRVMLMLIGETDA